MCLCVDTMKDLIIKVYGPRKGTNTSAIGVIVGREEIYMATQNAALKSCYSDVMKTKMKTLLKGVYKSGNVVDARGEVVTDRKRCEWTGYHAEMIILSAMVKVVLGGWVGKDINSRVDKVKSWGETYIVANADCCYHCGKMLDILGVGYGGRKSELG